MKKSQGYEWLLIVVLLASVGCQEKPRVPEALPPGTAEAQSLLDDIDKLERQLGLAVIAATPPRVGGDPFDLPPI